MPDLTRTIEILFEGTNRTGNVITSIGRDLDNLNYRVGNAVAPFADLTKGVIALDAALASLAIAGLAYAFNESKKFESSFVELKKVVGDNAEALDLAKTNAIELSGVYGDSASAILEATANYVQAGFDVKDSMALAKTGMDLVIAGGLDAAQSSEILISALKGFQAPASEATRLIDILNEVSNNFATDVEQLGLGMAGLSPIARQMGFSMEETAGILTPVIEIFRSGDEAAVALKTGLLKLIDDSKPVQEALASIGVSQRDANGELRSGKDILNDVAKAFQTLTPSQKTFITQQLVGINQSARMVEVFDGLSKSTAVTETALKSAGSASLEVAARLQTAEVAVNRLVAEFQNAAVSIGGKFSEATVEVIGGITDIWKAIREAVEAGDFDPLFDAINDFGRDLAKTFKDIAANLPEALAGVDFTGFISSLGGFRKEISGLFDGIDFGDPDDLARVIQRIIDSLESLVDFSKGLAGVFVDVAGYVADMIDKFNEADGSTKELFGSISGFGSVVSLITGPIGAITSAIEAIGVSMQILAGGQIINLSKALIGSKGLTYALDVVYAHPLIAAGAAGVAIGTAWRMLVPEVDAAAQSVYKFIDAQTGIFGIEAQNAENEREWQAIQERWSEIAEQRRQYAAEQEEQSTAAIEANRDNAVSVEWLSGEMEKLGILVQEPKALNVDTTDAKEKFQEIEYWIGDPDSGPRQLRVLKVPVDTIEVDKLKEKLDEIPAEKRLEFETDYAIAKLKSTAEVVKTSLEWKAKLDIAEVEAGARRLEAIAETVSDVFTSTGDVMGDLFKALNDAEFGSEGRIERQLDKEEARRQAAFELAQKLTLAEIKLTEARAKRFEGKDPLITITGDGLEPHLVAFMWEILAEIQIRASQEGIDELLMGGNGG